MEETKKGKDKFLIILLLLFIIFLILYISKETGYYEYKAHNKAVLTRESMKNFEKDVENGKNVSINDYLVSSRVDYSNSFTDVGYNLGKFIEEIMNNGIKKTLKLLGALFYK